VTEAGVAAATLESVKSDTSDHEKGNEFKRAVTLCSGEERGQRSDHPSDQASAWHVILEVLR